MNPGDENKPPAETPEEVAARVTGDGEGTGDKPAVDPADSKTGGGTSPHTHVHIHTDNPAKSKQQKAAADTPPPDVVGKPESPGASAMMWDILKIAAAAALAVSGITGLLK